MKLLDYFVEDHRAYLVLEHIDGLSLADCVKQNGKFEEAQTIDLCQQMCDILQYLSANDPPIIHRDFTPDNLILNQDGTLKLIDFNVAHQDSQDGTTGTVVGKPSYMPPEQFRGLPCMQSDLYAMGASLYFLLVGQDPVAISCANPCGDGASVSPELNLLVQKLTEPELSRRLKNINEVKAMLVKVKERQQQQELLESDLTAIT